MNHSEVISITRVQSNYNKENTSWDSSNFGYMYLHDKIIHVVPREKGQSFGQLFRAY